MRLDVRLSAFAVALALSCTGSSERAPTEPGHWVTGDEGRPSAPAKREPAPVPLERCSESGEGFDGWLVSFRRYAKDQGVSASTVDAVFAEVTYDQEVIDLDRSQTAFTVGFDEFLRSHVTPKRLARGKARKKELAPVLEKIEAKFGVPAEVLVAIWGLETDYGENVGNRSSLQSLSTLAYDCRRSALFRAELLSALHVLERGDLRPYQMVGAWAGEMGQTQFMPSSYERFAVDFDGDGRADLVDSSADALASTANFLRGHGWRTGEAFQPGSANFAVLAEWNASDLSRKTIAAFAVKLGWRAAK